MSIWATTYRRWRSCTGLIHLSEWPHKSSLCGVIITGFEPTTLRIGMCRRCVRAFEAREGK